jgi:hypothetical protein
MGCKACLSVDIAGQATAGFFAWDAWGLKRQSER